MLSAGFAARLRVPVVCAPMLHVSGPELVEAASEAGVVAAFPTSNARSAGELDEWLARLVSERSRSKGPICPNLIIRQARLETDLELLVRHRVEMVITSVGSPAEVIPPLSATGCRVFADVATLRHAERAVEAGADGLVLLSAGAGGQTGWLNPFAFVRAVRRWFDGPIILAGGMSDGVALAAAQSLGADLGYVGTRFIAAAESRADPAYKAMLVTSSMDDVVLTKAITGLPTSMLGPSLVAVGLNPESLDESLSKEEARDRFSIGASPSGPHRWTDLWSAGHSVSGVDTVKPIKDIVADLRAEFMSASNSEYKR